MFICGVPVAVPGFVGLTKTAKFAAAVVFKIFKTVGKSPEVGTLDMHLIYTISKGYALPISMASFAVFGMSLILSVILHKITLTMSKGLGSMQRDILDHLADPIIYEELFPEKPGEVIASHHNFIPHDEVYDLRHVMRILAKLHMAYELKVQQTCIDNKFQASFSRAAKNLVRTGVLFQLSFIPVKQLVDWGKNDLYCDPFYEGGSRFFRWPSKQLRFVTRSKVLAEIQKQCV